MVIFSIQYILLLTLQCLIINLVGDKLLAGNSDEIYVEEVQNASGSETLRRL
jgi:hypothetical protein